jgi:twitching motility protein PilT
VPEIGRFRTNLFQQRGQWCLAMRYVKTVVPSFEELGLLEQTRKIAESPRGIVLVAGSTGSGKSTTLAAMIEHINANFKKHIITLEDPIEYVFEDNQCVVEQREVGLDTLSFHHALKHVLRQDPDIIMIGEMRDSVSFTAAMSAADTGHLVLSTLHTTNASQSVNRILDFFKADEREQIRRQLAGTLQAVVCQRMVGTVAAGMTPALEIMINTPTVKKLIEENRLDKLQAAIETGTDDGMLNFNQALFNLVKQGKVSEKEALAKATNPQALEMNFKGIFLDEGRRILS